MSYEYTDTQGLKLLIQSRDNYGWDCVEIGAHTDDGTFWRAFKVEDAPAVALAILEAAGLADDPWSETCAAVKALQRHEKVRVEKAAEAEAKRLEQAVEDEKVCDYFELVNDGARPDWGIIPESTKRDCRTEYRRAKRAAAQGFFTCDVDAKAPEPLVVKLGDPEPDRTKRFLERGEDGNDTWGYFDNGWTWAGGSPRYSWERFQHIWPEVFPLTEVTE